MKPHFQVSRKFFKLLKFEEVEYFKDFENPSICITKEEIYEKMIVTEKRRRSDLTKEEMIYNVASLKNENFQETKKVLILLHGLNDNKKCWTEKANLLETFLYLYDKKEIDNMVFVIPDSGYAGQSWYANFHKEKDFRYEDYFATEFMEDLKFQFPNAEFGITGFSMGGHGAFKIGIKNSEKFKVVGSFAGAINLTRLIMKQRVSNVLRATFIPTSIFTNFDDVHFLRVFGQFGNDILKNNPYHLISNINFKDSENINFYASVGTHDLDPYYMYLQWIDMVYKLKKYKFNFKATVYQNEEHEWSYVGKDLYNFLKYFNEKTN